MLNLQEERAEGLTAEQVIANVVGVLSDKAAEHSAKARSILMDKMEIHSHVDQLECEILGLKDTLEEKDLRIDGLTILLSQLNQGALFVRPETKEQADAQLAWAVTFYHDLHGSLPKVNSTILRDINEARNANEQAVNTENSG